MTMRHRPHSNGQKAEAFIHVLTLEVGGAEMYYASGYSEFKMNQLYDKVSVGRGILASLWLCAECDPNRDKLLRTTNPQNVRLLNATPTQDNPHDKQEYRAP